MRIVVVEDESNSREGLVRLIGKLDDSYEVVGEADNGTDGMAIIERSNPDLVITDIQMPGMTGLAMLESLRNKGLRHKMIILTGYSEFEYAHKAIKMNVSDYLEKPITAPDLREALAKVKNEMAEQQLAPAHPAEAGAIESLFLSLLDSEAEDAANLEARIREKTGYAEGLPYSIAVFSYDRSLATQHSNFKLKLEEQWRKVSRCAVFGIASRGVVVCVVQALEDGFDCLAYLNGVILSDAVGSEYVCSFGKVNDLSNLNMDIEEMLKLAKWSMILGNRKAIVQAEIDSENKRELPYPSALEGRCSRAVISANGDEIRKQFGAWTNEFIRDKYSPALTIDYCTRFVSYMLRLAGELHGFRLREPLARDWPRLLREVRTLHEFVRIMDELASKLAEMDTSSEAPVYNLYVQKAVRIIQERYAEGISLEEIAGSLHISTTYLSNQFNREVGHSFSAYIKDLRLRKAKELLLGSGLKTFEIALKVGYPDPKYFSRVFKEATGMSPGEYQKLNVQSE